MSPNRDAVEFHQELADSVIAELSTDLSRVSAYFGEQYADADVPEARDIRHLDVIFDWITFGFDPHSMWDAHVGVLTNDGRVTVGLHIHERLSPTRPAAVVDIAYGGGAEYRSSDAAAEHQFNLPSVSIDSVDIDNLAEEVSAFCRRFEPMVDDLEEASSG